MRRTAPRKPKQPKRPSIWDRVKPLISKRSSGKRGDLSNKKHLADFGR